MTKKGLVGSGLGVAIIAIAIVIYFLLGGGPHQGPVKPEKAVSTSQAPVPEAKAPAAGPAAPAAPAQPKQPVPEQAAPPETTSPQPHLGPATIPKAALPPLEPEHKYGLVIGSYHKYHDAAKRMARVKKLGEPAFIDKYRGKYRVFVGPFPTLKEAREAAKSLKARHHIAARIHEVVIPVAK